MKWVLDIKPLDGYEWECFIGHIITVSEWWKLDYFVSFNQSWVFSPYKPLHTIDEIYQMLGTLEPINCNLLMKYSGLKIQTYNCEDIVELYDIIKDQLSQRKPVMIKVDVFACPWFVDDYHIAHAPHWILISGIDLESNCLYCVDVSFQIYKGKLNKEQVNLGFMGMVITFRHNENLACLSVDEHIDKLQTTTEKMLDVFDNINKFGSMRILANQLGVLYQKSITIQGNIKKTAIIVEIIKILQSRMYFYNYIRSLRRVRERLNVFAIEANFQQIIELWTFVKINISRAYYKNHDCKLLNESSIIINKIAYLEEQTARAIMDFCKKY
jgi:hypothetical protein